MDNPGPADPDEMYRRPQARPAALPSIADYWPDAPHRIGPPADHYTDEPTAGQVDALRRSGARDRPGPTPGDRIDHAGPGGGRPHRRSRKPLLLGAVLAVLLVAGAGLAGVALVRSGDRDAGPATAARPAATASPESAPASARSAPGADAVISAPARGRDEAVFELVSDTATIDLRAADLGDDLYRITTPARGSVLPRAELSAAGVKLFLDDNGARGDAAVTVLLNAGVRWSMTITGGIRKGVFDLSAAEVDAVDFAGGAARIDLTLPRPDGTLGIRMSGGVNRFEVVTGQGVPVRVRTRRGAGQVKLDGRTDDGVARGASFLSPEWAGSKNRIDLDAVAGVGTLRIGRG